MDVDGQHVVNVICSFITNVQALNSEVGVDLQERKKIRNFQEELKI